MILLTIPTTFTYIFLTCSTNTHPCVSVTVLSGTTTCPKGTTYRTYTSITSTYTFPSVPYTEIPIYTTTSNRTSTEFPILTIRISSRKFTVHTTKAEPLMSKITFFAVLISLTTAISTFAFLITV